MVTSSLRECAPTTRIFIRLENVEFLEGETEVTRLPDDHVDVVISNRIMNLCAEKERVLGEATEYSSLVVGSFSPT
jgi:arsenite methyltransferase